MPKLKICGMKFQENITQVADLQPDYLGFIFYEKSPRFFNGNIPKINPNIKKTGVFVNAEMSYISGKIKQHNLKAVQLHGSESVTFCKEIKEEHHQIEIIKAFSVGDTFNFNTLTGYTSVVDFLLFDTKGKQPGGNGYTFDWQLLNNYPFDVPFFLSGGIGLDEVKSLQRIKSSRLPLYAIDINSKFEISPGLKNIELLQQFTQQL